MLRKTNVSGFVKDDITYVVVNRNSEQKQQYYAAKEKLLKLNSLKDELDSVKNEVRDLKELIATLAKGK